MLIDDSPPSSPNPTMPYRLPPQNISRLEHRYRSVALSVVLMGVMMTAIDTTAVVLALPVMMLDLQSDIISMVWVIMVYLLMLTVFGTQGGRLGDIYGRVRMYNLGFAIFTVGSLLCGLSLNAPELIGFRIIQGIGGALVFSNSGAIIADTVPGDSRGSAYGLTGIGYSVGAILGILVGGAIITFVSWRYILFINVPVGVAAVIVGYRFLRERSPRIAQKIDLAGMALLGASLFLILYALTEMTGSGFTSLNSLELTTGGVLVFCFVLWEGRYSAPLLELSLLRDRILTASISAAFFQSLASFAVLFLVIMYLQGARGLSPLDASLLLVPGYLLGGVLSPFAGRHSDRYGARVTASIGLVLQAVGILVYASLEMGSPLWMIIVGSIVNGAGASFFFPANNSAVMANAPPKAYGVASGVLRTISNTGMVSSFAVALLLASLSIPRDLAFEIFLGVSQLTTPLANAFVTGMRSALLASIALILVAIVLSILRGPEARTLARTSHGEREI